jgi:hypothetical protein
MIALAGMGRLRGEAGEALIDPPRQLRGGHFTTF